MDPNEKSTKTNKYLSLEAPSIEELQEWLEEGVCPATDGCIVEPDGTDPKRDIRFNRNRCKLLTYFFEGKEQ